MYHMCTYFKNSNKIKPCKYSNYKRYKEKEKIFKPFINKNHGRLTNLGYSCPLAVWTFISTL